jgi:hypothetical protein
MYIAIEASCDYLFSAFHHPLPASLIHNHTQVSNVFADGCGSCVDVMQEREDASLSDCNWDRFARTEYIRLAMEEGEDAEPESSTDLWESGISQPPF